MRDRLIGLLKQIYFDYCEECCACTEDGYRCPPTLEEFFADHLLENGVIVPKVKVGDKLYVLSVARTRANEYYVTHLEVYDCGVKIFARQILSSDRKYKTCRFEIEFIS